MQKALHVSLLSLTLLLSQIASAQSAFEYTRELELGAIFTSGNTEDQNIKFQGRFKALRDAWEHAFSIDGFRSSKDDELAAQRLYSVASTTYTFTEDNFVLTRLAHEDDRFSGYDGQTDFSVNYGQRLLRGRETMAFSYTIGAGARYSRSPEEDFSEAMLRLGALYTWSVSDNALFRQQVSVEAGESSTISRWESSIQSQIMEDLSMKFAIKVKHQTEVPPDRENTDTESSITLLLSF